MSSTDGPDGTGRRPPARNPRPDDLRSAGETSRRPARPDTGKTPGGTGDEPADPQQDASTTGEQDAPGAGADGSPGAGGKRRRTLEDRARDVGRTVGKAGTEAGAAYLTAGSSAAAQAGARGATSKISGAVGEATGEAAASSVRTLKLAVAAVALLVGGGGVLLFLLFAGALSQPDPWADIEMTEKALEELDDDIVEIYKDAASQHQVPWTVLAGLGSVLTGHGTSDPQTTCLRYRGDLPESAWTSSLYPTQELLRCDATAYGDTVRILPFVDPPIGTYTEPNDALGPMLLTPRAAGELASTHGWDADSDDPHPAQYYDLAVDHVAAELSAIADQMRSEGLDYDPRSPDAGDAADTFWAEAIDRLGTVIGDPNGTAPRCGRPPLSDPPLADEIGGLVTAVFRCEVDTALRQRGTDLHVATDVLPNGKFTYVSGQQAGDLIVDEALEVSHRYSGWDVDRCATENSAAPLGIFPLPDGPGCDDPVGNIERAAELVVTGHMTSPAERRAEDSSSFEPMEGGWSTMPAVFGSTSDRNRLHANGPYDPPAPTAECRTHIQRRLLDLAEVDGADTFANYVNFAELFSGFADPDDLSGSALTQYFTLRDALAEVRLRGNNRIGADGQGPCGDLADVDDRDFLYAYVGPAARHLAADLSTDLLAITGDSSESDPNVIPEPGGQAPEPGPAPTGTSAGDTDLIDPDDLDIEQVTRQANVAHGVGSFIADTHTTPDAPGPGDPLLSRLHPYDHDDVTPPKIPAHLTTSGARLSIGDQALRKGSSYGGTVLDDARYADGASPVAGTLPGCGNTPTVTEDATTAEIAQMVYQVFYCQAVVLGLDAIPPAEGPTDSPHNPRALGMTNKAQQVASEAVIVGWCESVGYSYKVLWGWSDPSHTVWSGDNGFQATVKSGNDRVFDTGYAGLFQMGPTQGITWIPNWSDPQRPEDDLRYDPVANAQGAASYYFAGHGNPKAWDGWSPWAVVYTPYGGPNDHVAVPVLPRFPSTDPQYLGQYGPELPRWAVNPFVDGIFPDHYGDAPCGPAYGRGQPHTWPTLDPQFASVGPPAGDVLERLQPTAAGIVCPVPDTTSFYNDWAFRRGGGSRPHTGTDVFAAEGAPIVAPGDGTIEYVQNADSGNSGLSVAILLDNGMRWVFVHNLGHPTHIVGGAQVAAGDVIGYVGKTGNAATTPPHAHTELRLDGRQSPKVNPYHYLADACPNAGGMPFEHPPMYLIDLLPEFGAVREMPWPDGHQH